MFGGFGMWEVILIFLVILLLFGAKRLPEIGSSLGKGIREFKGSLREIEGEFKAPDEGTGSTSSGGTNRSGTSSDDEKDGGNPRKLTTSQ